MKNVLNFTTELNNNELININGGDGITEAVFWAIGFFCAVTQPLFQDHQDPDGLGGSRPFE